jgi:hypothetical protein
MSAIRNVLTVSKALAALVAVCATTSAARADLTLEINDNIGTVAPVFVDLGPTGTTTSATTTAFVPKLGYMITYSASESYSSGVASLSLTASATNIGVGGKYLPETFTFSLLSGPIYPSGGTIGLTSSVSTTTLVGNSSVSTNTAYTGYNIAGTSIQSVTPPSYTYGASVSQSGATATGPTYTLTPVAGTSSFKLGLTAVLQGDSVVGTTSFDGTSKGSGAKAISVPETSGLTAALTGLPCFGLLIGLVRRYRTGLAPVVAA